MKKTTKSKLSNIALLVGGAVVLDGISNSMNRSAKVVEDKKKIDKKDTKSISELIKSDPFIMDSLKGNDGESIYQIARKYGYQGTEQQFAKENIIQKSMNLLIPNFIEGSYYMTSGVIGTNSTYIRTSALIKVNPNTTYTISGIKTNYVGAEYSTDDVSSFIRKISEVKPSGQFYTSLTFTTSANTNYIGINIKGSNNTLPTGTEMLVLGDTIIPYQKYGVNYINGNELVVNIGDSFPKVGFELNITGSGGNPRFYVYTKLKSKNSLYTRFTIQRETDNSIRKDIYKISGASVFEFDGKNMVSKNIEQLTSTESEFAFKVSGKTDFTGGYHGDELLTNAIFLVDGIPLSLAENISFTFCETFQYVQQSDLLETDNSVNTIVAKHTKSTIFQDFGYTTYNRIVGVSSSILLTHCYFGLCTIHNTISTSFFSESGVLLNNMDDNSELFNSINDRTVTYYNNSNKRGAKVSSKVLSPIEYDQECTMRVWDSNSAAYNKYYRTFQNKTLSIGDIWEGESTVEFY